MSSEMPSKSSRFTRFICSLDYGICKRNEYPKPIFRVRFCTGSTASDARNTGID